MSQVQFLPGALVKNYRIEYNVIMENPDFEDFFEEISDEETEEIIDYLVSQGAAIWDGVDEYGERMFKFNMEVLKEVDPKLYSEVMGDLDEIMMDLWQQDLVELEYDEELNAKFRVSEEGVEALRELGIEYLINDDPDSF